jgi:Uma2 family endonuclease
MTPPTAAPKTLTAPSSDEAPTVEAPTVETLNDVEANDVIWPPNDLYSDEPPLENTLHLRQMILLLNCLDWLWKDRENYFAAGNLTVYYNPNKLINRDFRGPDFFVALDTHPAPRKSWMVWEEDGKYPNVIVELLSDSTAEVDRTSKKQLYAETFRTPEYFWFDPESYEFEGFILHGSSYLPITPTEQGWRWSEQLQLFLGIHDGLLRFFNPDGIIVPTPEEAASDAEQALASEQMHSAKLAEKLRALGVNPDAD